MKSFNKNIRRNIRNLKLESSSLAVWLHRQTLRIISNMLFCFCLIGDQSNVTVSPSGRSSTFAFSRKQKKIPSALKEVTWSCTLPIMQWHAAFALCNVTVMKVSVSTTKLIYVTIKIKSCSQVSANTENSSMTGYLQRSKGHKKPWKRLWFVIKNKVLYTYAASEVCDLYLCNNFRVLKATHNFSIEAWLMII